MCKGEGNPQQREGGKQSMAAVRSSGFWDAAAAAARFFSEYHVTYDAMPIDPPGERDKRQRRSNVPLANPFIYISMRSFFGFSISLRN